MESKDPTVITIGLFGTCGGSRWRDAFEREYKKCGIPYFNPQVDTWDPSMSEREAWHMANDDIIVFAITEETYSTGSLSKISFSILQAISLQKRRNVVIYIDSDLAPELLHDVRAAEESSRLRALVKAHVKTLQFANVYLVHRLTDLLNASLYLYGIEQNCRKLRHQIGT